MPPRSLPRALARSSAFCLALLCLAQAQAMDTSRWYAVLMDGRKIGHLETSRSESPAGIAHRDTLRMTLDRNGETVEFEVSEATLETPEGAPISFSSRLDTAGTRMASEASVADGWVEWRAEGGPAQESRRFAWPDGALLAHGQRLMARARGTAPGTRYAYRSIELGSGQSIDIDVSIGAVEQVALPAGNVEAVTIRQRARSTSGVQEAELWLDPASLDVLRLRMPLMGMTLDAVHCDRSCAEAPNQPGDVFAATLVDAPRPLGARERGKPLRYRLLIDDQAPGALPSSPGQTADEDGRWLRVDPAGGQDRAPGPGDLGANRWLQSTHPELVALAAEFAGEGGTARQRMRRLETAVGRHIAVKSLRVGYASALDAARLGEGDCTEHALLLAALARADGIPARVATGLAYAPGFAGRESVFVPHAWVFAWTGKRWEGFDAALGGYGSGHIALETGDGDPLHFASGTALLGRLRITDIERGGRR